MPPTIIAKRIRSGLRSAGENANRTRDLVHYITADENQEGMPKCAAIDAIGFPSEDYNVREMIEALLDDMSLPSRKDGERLSHWVISWKGEPPEDEEIFAAAKEHMAALGYTEDHKQIYTIHKDREHVHVHVAACRVDQWTGKVLREGNNWYKNESQKALIRIAERYGWELEPGHRFTKKRRTGPKKNDKATAIEKQTGRQSEQTKLIAMLARFLEEHEADFPNWKFGHFHAELARLGIECQRREIKPNAYGIVFSLDGETFCKATTVCPEMTHSKLLKRMGTKGWRDARPETRAILEEARKELARQDGHAKARPVSRPRRAMARKIAFNPGHHRLYRLYWRFFGNLQSYVTKDTSRHRINSLIALQLKTIGHSDREIMSILYNGLARQAKKIPYLGNYCKAIVEKLGEAKDSLRRFRKFAKMWKDVEAGLDREPIEGPELTQELIDEQIMSLDRPEDGMPEEAGMDTGREPIEGLELTQELIDGQIMLLEDIEAAIGGRHKGPDMSQDLVDEQIESLDASMKAREADSHDSVGRRSPVNKGKMGRSEPKAGGGLR